MVTTSWLTSLLAYVAIVIALDPSKYVPFNKSQLADDSIFEQFEYESLEQSPWVVSANDKYLGLWSIEEGTNAYVGFEGDKGLVMKLPASHSAISLPVKFTNKEIPLVLQYEVKLQNGLSCGGAYVKLLTAPINGKQFNSETGYEVMFGPDMCGSQNKVHFIINRCNPKTEECEEKHLTVPPMAKTGQLTNLYTLILHPRGAFEIRINGQVAKYANILDRPHLLSPPLNPPVIIEDPEDIKPEGWDAEPEFIEDPTVTKPDNYEQLYGSRFIPDPDVVKPKNWLEDEPEYIEDPESTKPQLWNDDEDGEYVKPVIPNPKCEGMVCGKKWENHVPVVPNPDYKGPWIHPKIANPKFNGEWRPRQILNPDYYEDVRPFNFRPIGGIGFELWSMEGSIMFDNIYLGHRVSEAELIGNSTFLPKQKLESKNYELHRPKAKHEPVAPPKSVKSVSDLDDLGIFEFFRLLIRLQLNNVFDFIYDFQLDPAETIIREPVKFIAYCFGFVFLFTIVFGFGSVVMFLFTQAVSSLFSPAPPPVIKPNDEVEEETPVEIEEIQVEEPKLVEIFDDDDTTKEVRHR
ncbi:uncharacterized protein KQ657_003568 [Scheffersomyces spartinae]|uniref:Calnexin n=1 Tax=Scheffersomyces spartinae TaxID=45513 RepID=A0A9P7V4X8_9ASCO|nr:uncharacterized protein KQ657_003568 [Scheffersomyces spartinae]KAG7191327.1 hypothetical protein KQ657_003568 [Scheffersomyces spartinae]